MVTDAILSTKLSRQLHTEDFLKPDGIYLLNHAVGCMPQHAAQVASDFFKVWAQKGNDAWDTWLEILTQFCQTIAKLLQADSQQICPQVNISSALTKILYSLPERAQRRKIILSEADFPSIGFVLEQATRNGYKLKFITKHELNQGLSSWEKYLQDDVQLVFLTHVFSNSSYRNPVSDITHLARTKGIFSVVDVAQSAGVIPLNVTQWSADFVIGSCLKWLCGGPGAGFLWIDHTNLKQFKPLDVGWFSHMNPFEFDIHHFDYANTAQRFLGGTPSVLPFAIAAASLKLLLTIGIETIYQHNQQLLQRLIQAAIDSKLKICSPLAKHERGGTLVIEFKDAQQARQLFAKNDIKVDVRELNKFRLSPHIYNTTQEVNTITRLWSGL